jgi:putative ABC transport system permease protein
MKPMFTRILAKSLAKRRSRVALAVLAVVMGASMASALLTTSYSINEKLASEFRQFGANIMVLPRSETIDVGLPGISLGSVTEQRYISESALWNIKKIQNWSANVLGYAPFLYQVVNARSGAAAQQLVLAGTYFDHPVPQVQKGDGGEWTTGLRTIALYWEVRGGWVEKDDDLTGAMVGATVAEKLGLSAGSGFDVNYTDPDTAQVRTAPLVVRGIVTTGGSEDAQIFVNLEVAQNLTARPDKVHTVQVSALCFRCPAETIAKEIQYVMPDVQAKSVRQLVKSENMIMMRLENMMGLVTAIALGASALGVMTTMTTSVIERRREIGLMKAIGSTGGNIGALFLVEAAIIGLIGGVAGFAVGYVLAQFIGESVFGSAVTLVPLVIPMTIGISVAVSLLAAVVPVRRALGIEPAAVLRGD